MDKGELVAELPRQWLITDRTMQGWRRTRTGLIAERERQLSLQRESERDNAEQ